MSKKHFQKAAEIIQQSCDLKGHPSAEKTRRLLANTFADFFQSDNARFDRARFLEACGVK